MTIEEAAPDAEAMASLIHQQSGYVRGCVDVEAIARALDIKVVQREPLGGFDGMLLTQPERTDGAILVNNNNFARRQRFSIGHELGHFLNIHHRPTTEAGFACADKEQPIDGIDWKRHRQQEREADTFAGALLMPRTVMDAVVSSGAGLAEIIDVAKHLDVSKQAIVRRFVEVQHNTCAMVVHNQGRVAWVGRSRFCPRLSLNKGDPVGELPRNLMFIGTTTRPQPVSASSWGLGDNIPHVLAQTHFQQDNRGITLLTLG